MQTAFTQKNCSNCGRTFGCGVTSNEDCWCTSSPLAVVNPDPKLDCFCPECLAKQLAEPAALEQPALVQGEDYYLENGLLVMTPAYHLKRGSCCGSQCRWCPFDPKYEAGATKLDSEAAF